MPILGDLELELEFLDRGFDNLDPGRAVQAAQEDAGAAWHAAKASVDVTVKDARAALQRAQDAAGRLRRVLGLKRAVGTEPSQGSSMGGGHADRQPGKDEPVPTAPKFRDYVD